ncbi:MAG TPA: Gldg family protein [Xanthomonadaceae bacterium]|nr:Gldg family protein [Xanthomonadaceae bacterium]
MNALKRQSMTAGTLVVLAVLFVALVVLSNATLRGLRFDLTDHKLYTLSEGTRQVVAELDEPINLYFFYSDRGTQNIPFLRSYAQRVREFLEEVASASRGKVRLSVIDPLPFSEDEDRASGYGLQAVPTGTGESIFFGLAGTNALDGQAAIPFFQPDKETFLEYDVAKLIHSLGEPVRPVVGVISRLPMTGGFDPNARQMREPWAVLSELRQIFDVRELNHGATEIDPEVQVLMLVHPKELSEDTLYAIDQFVLRGGRLVAFIDPFAETDDSAMDPENPSAAMFASRSSQVGRLFDAWGIEFDADQVVLDRGTALAVSVAQGRPPQRHPAILGLGPGFLNNEDVVSAQLSSINMASAGHLRVKEDATLELVPLIQSSRDAMAASADRLRFLAADPSSLFQEFAASNEHYVLAGRLSGSLKTAFPGRSGDGHLAESATDVQMIVVADTDILTDRLWVQVTPFLGQRIMNAFANNGDFIVNAIDNMTGSSALISVRGRAVSSRPFTTVDDLRRLADERFRAKEQELQEQLAETERRVNELQRGKDQTSALVLSGEQRAELQRFQDEKLRIRRELRQVRRQLDADIEALGTRLKIINIGLMPLLITFAAIGFAWWRVRRRRQAEGAQA